MQEMMQTVPIAHSHVHVRLVLESFDSAEECSFSHWLEVCRLVDEGDVPSQLSDSAMIAELEPAAWN
ncbi:MAG TPA: hypothetical protein VG225_05020 [Terracidiphilus sp.]|jgi:hypothetical protein|nr:hypothetical protein [Terracidiphilus sp.]